MRLAAAAAAAGLAAVSMMAHAWAQGPAQPLAVRSVQLPLDVDRPERSRLGALTWAGGLLLKAPGSPRFGGLSGIDVSEDGRFISQSDAGDLVTGRLVLGPDRRLAGVEDTALARLTDEQGQPYPPDHKAAADAEDITYLPAGGFAVSFEQRHRVQAYTGAGPARRLGVPPEAEALHPNSGLEALTAWTDGAGRARLLEGAEDGRIWSCDPEGRDCALILDRASRPHGYRLTGLDALPGDGGLVAVYRGFDLLRGFRAVIAWVRPGSEHPVTELARLAPPYTLDNMEGIAAVPAPDGGVRLYLISDDNFMAIQRTLLLAFDWKPQAGPEGEGR